MGEYDVVIVGAGPSGVSVASKLKDQDIKVLIVEKEKLPRYKPCGGGFTRKTLSLLSIPYSEEVRFTAKELSISYEKRMAIIVSGTEVLAKLFERKDFDMFYLKNFLGTNIEVKDNVSIKEISYTKEEFVLKTEEETIRCKYLIGADGVNSIVNKTLGIVDKNYYGFGVEASCPVDSRSIGKYRMRYDFERSIKGYFWIFPKGEHLCIGAYSSCRKVKDIDTLLAGYISDLGLNYEEHFRGHLVPFYGINYVQPHIPCILVGDAAGFGDKLTGEGIYYAIKSGQIAGEFIVSGFKTGSIDYKELQEQYDRQIIGSLKIGYLLGNIFFNNLPISYRFLRLTFVIRLFYEVFAKGYTYRRIGYNILPLLRDITLNRSNVSKEKVDLQGSGTP